MNYQLAQMLNAKEKEELNSTKKNLKGGYNKSEDNYVENIDKSSIIPNYFGSVDLIPDYKTARLYNENKNDN